MPVDVKAAMRQANYFWESLSDESLFVDDGFGVWIVRDWLRERDLRIRLRVRVEASSGPRLVGRKRSANVAAK